MKKWIHNHLMSLEFLALLSLLVVSIMSGLVWFVMIVAGVFAFWLWLVISLIIAGVREEMKKQ